MLVLFPVEEFVSLTVNKTKGVEAPSHLILVVVVDSLQLISEN